MSEPIFQETETKHYETLPSEVKYNFRKNFKLSEKFLSSIFYKVIIKDNLNSDFYFYLNEDRISGYWTDYWRVYATPHSYIGGEEVLLWQGLIVYASTYFSLSDIWRALYPREAFGRFYPAWNSLGNKIIWAINPDYPGEGAKIYLSGIAISQKEGEYFPMYSQVRVTKNLPDQEYRESSSNHTFNSTEEKYFIKKAERNYDLIVEGNMYKKAPVKELSITGTSTLDETYSIEVEIVEEIPKIKATRINYIVGTTPNHTVWIPESIETKFKLISYIINPKIFYGDKKNVI